MEDNIDKFLKKTKEYIVKYKFIVIGLIVLSIIIFGFNYIKNDKDIENIKNYYSTQIDKNNMEDKKTNHENAKIMVHIDGEVNSPGVYTMESNSRLDDLVKLAGGLTNEANTNLINLAEKLNDGQKVHIYNINEEVLNNLLESSTNGKININTADIEELKTLPGIGDSTANKIIKYRESNGRFLEIEDILNVNGIGQSKFDNIKDMICV